ncbi:MAG: hypothetical protein D6791_18620 [Chloroflexi bacterium]|nr:MAG: hypothetical protein D6791_18620 [Chloroflexota bacterium]
MVASLGAAAGLGVWGVLQGDLPVWGMLISAGAGGVLLLRHLWRAGSTGWWLAATLAGLAGVAMQALFLAILPALG